MTAIQLRDELNKYIEQGNGDAQIVFDTEAGAFDYHLADLHNVTLIKKEEFAYKSDMVILTSDDTRFYNWEVNSLNEDEEENVKPTNYSLGDNHECKMLSQGDERCTVCGKQMF